MARPYLANECNGGWWLHDEPAARARRRNDEWIAWSGTDPVALHSQARERSAGKFLLDVVVPAGAEAGEVLAPFRRLGYRLWRTETLMWRRTDAPLAARLAAAIHAVTTRELADELAAAAGGRLMLPEHICAEQSPVRCHVARSAGRLVGWVRSIALGRSAWCASMFVDPEFRRRGYGRALVAAMLQADHAAAHSWSILVATPVGAKLYSAVGYTTAGQVLVLVPPKP